MAFQSPQTASSLSAMALLDPKGARKNGTASKALANTYDHKDLSREDSNGEVGAGKFLEQYHKVQPRVDRPMKKAKHEHKKSDEDDLVEVQEKPDFKGIAGTGELGQHVKEYRKQLEVQQGGFVDLTNGSSFDTASHLGS